MKKAIIITMISMALLAVSCARNYSKDLVGKWYAGKATFNNNDLMVTIKPDGALVAEITNADVRPVNATYTLERDKLVIKFTGFDLSYRIKELDKDLLVMESRYGRITWKRIK
ncbi:MAG: hypothetical protein JXA07_10270 [Spirochaetes bacterium]|nr:hypothetical protein [Spirochaetota bacterium]